ncbi:MAG TPA: M55 family metallopeptidase [Planctomycetota bacterium]|nr:M55 family metallopeptidase [Planctomycetota bacterium]
MKVYIMTDMEGISGIHRVEYVQRGSDRYAEGRKLLTADVNACIAGCFDGGATEVVAADAHGGGDHFLMEEIDERAVIDHIGNGRWCGCLDESFDAAMVVGQHAMAGTLNGFLDHTQSSTSWYEFTINGKAVGELGQFACQSGAFDVPVVLVTGDKAATEEATELLGAIEVAAVKEGVGRNLATCLAPQKAHKLIREAAARALKLVGKIKPWKPRTPIEVVLRLNRSDYADGIALRPGNERLDARTLRRVVDHPLHIFDIFMDTRPAS